MQRELQQSVIIVAGKIWAVLGATCLTFLTGMANVFEVIQPIIGGTTSLLALVITFVLFRKRDRLLEREIKLKEAQLRAIDERHPERFEDNA